MPRKKLPKAWPLNIFLLKEGVSTDAVLQEDQAIATQVVPIGDAGHAGTLAIRSRPPKKPGWADFFEGAADLTGALSASTAAVLLVQVEERLFALTFGYGRSLLSPGCWEERFGLLVTLNCVDPDAIRSVDKKRFDANVKQSREQTSKATDITSGFGFEIERDLLCAVTGTPVDQSLGVRMTGADALSVSARTRLGDLPQLLTRYLRESQGTQYRDRFEFIDHISEVKSVPTRVGLDEALAERLMAGGSNRLFMCPPEVVNWRGVAYFRYGEGKNSPLHEDLHVSELLASFRNPDGLTAQSLRSKRVHCVGSASDTPIHTWSAYQCLQCEIEQGDHMYLLSGGKWYRVAQDFVAQVNAAVESVPPSSLTLPDFVDSTEADYNRRVCEESAGEFKLMDGPPNVIRHGGGRSQIEFCDLYSTAQQLVHVKRYRSSEDLSHLFAQGRVSAELLLTDPEFRSKVNDKLAPTHSVDGVDSRPDPSSYEVVFAVISRSQSPLPSSLPFFSRVTLRHSVRQLRDAYNFRVSLAKIQA